MTASDIWDLPRAPQNRVGGLQPLFAGIESVNQTGERPHFGLLSIGVK
jgi:hypothetical protein